MVMTTAPSNAEYHLPESNLLFKKVYDGIPGGNELHGTCHVGQLIAKGVDQEVYNGQSLSRSYITFAEDTMRLKLFNHSSLAAAGGNNDDQQHLPLNRVYFRGDDQQRTLMSGQILVESMFPTTVDASCSSPLLVDWHTVSSRVIS
jgi:hypothetical protein